MSYNTKYQLTSHRGIVGDILIVLDDVEIVHVLYVKWEVRGFERRAGVGFLEGPHLVSPLSSQQPRIQHSPYAPW